MLFQCNLFDSLLVAKVVLYQLFLIKATLLVFLYKSCLLIYRQKKLLQVTLELYQSFSHIVSDRIEIATWGFKSDYDDYCHIGKEKINVLLR